MGVSLLRTAQSLLTGQLIHPLDSCAMAFNGYIYIYAINTIISKSGTICVFFCLCVSLIVLEVETLF